MSGTGSTEASSATVSILKRKSNDVGWEYEMLIDPKNMDKVKCKLCSKVMSGGVYRVKEHIGHISGNVSACPKASPDDRAKCKNAIEEARNKKKNKKKEEDLMRSTVNISEKGEGNGDDELQELGSNNPPRTLGPMDKFASSISPEAGSSVKMTQRQQNINEALFKERTQTVREYCARWVYEHAIPFNAIDNDSFKLFVEVVGQFGPGFNPPSQYQLRETLLKGKVDRMKGLLKKHEEEWARNGCSIMTDAWSDRKRRSIMNLCVNSNAGTAFLSSKESSEEAHTSELIFEYVDKCIEQVGPQNVVQVVTDNAANNMGAAKLLKVKRPNIFWTSCATHTINLMLESIGKLPRYKKVIDQAKSLTIFIYVHHKTLSLMRSFTKKRDIVRPGVTRFASSFLTLQSLMEKKSQLRAMFTSSEWEECKWSKTVKGKAAYATVLSIAFWNGVTICLKVFAPLVKVLRIVDADKKPSMGFLYGEINQAKKDIKEALNNLEKNYLPIMEIIDTRVKDRLDSPLPFAAYLLNPYYLFKDMDMQFDNELMDEFFNAVEMFFYGDDRMQGHILNVELPKYTCKEGVFGKSWAIQGCATNDDNYNPVKWWMTYGNQTPNLQRMARRILSLTSSSSGCERNWSTFEGIHTKKRNRLDVNRLNNLVFVQFNAKLMNKQKREKERNVDVLLASDASNAQGWIVDGEDERTS
ncbi:uncharacterized protein LOC127794391 [Diospyros lotus]|uniref:uncharacterized protein LOC127794391 n=1 Tax=Diospyros lotus TaxID=55363 RepID=UPI00224DD498|nr:uncharacterized protein LOC127794391 [Diospyros lotus]